jgi:hypothetical protein
MDPAARVVHRRLEAWASWNADTEARGFPLSTPIARMMKYGVAGAVAAPVPVEIPDAIADVDAAVGTLPQAEAQAIRRYYLRWEPIEASARALRLTPRQFQALLKCARMRIEMTLDYYARLSRDNG